MEYKFTIDYDILKRALGLYRSDPLHDFRELVDKLKVYGVSAEDAMLIWQCFEIMEENPQYIPSCTYVKGRGMLG
jgi:hypothetical protein